MKSGNRKGAKKEKCSIFYFTIIKQHEQSVYEQKQWLFSIYICSPFFIVLFNLSPVYVPGLWILGREQEEGKRKK